MIAIPQYVSTLSESQLTHCIELCEKRLKEQHQEEKVVVWVFITDNFAEDYFMTFEGACRYAFERCKYLDMLDKRHKEFQIRPEYLRASEVEAMGVKP